MDPLLARTLDNKYLIEKLLGKGGMGSVYLALHTGTKRNVAVKVIAPQYMRNKELLIRFQREAEATGRLNHPNVVNVTDFGVTVIDGTAIAYLVMEYLQGETLQEFLQKNPTPPPDFVLDVLEQTALGITEAHSRGILHRDLKPQNIWLQPDGRGGSIVKVLDFGIAKLADPSALSLELPELEAAPNVAAGPASPGDQKADDNATVVLAPTELGLTSAFAESSGFTTTFGATLGTPAFMAPEQCSGKAVSERSDLYSLAMISYLMLTGELPFRGNARELIEQQVTLTPDAPHTRNSRLGEAVSRPILQSLAKDPEYRAPNLLAFVARLRSAIHGEVHLLKESRTSGALQSGAWFGFLIFAGTFAALFLVAARFVFHRAVEANALELGWAVAVVAAVHAVSSYCALLMADMMMTRWTLHLREGEGSLRAWLDVLAGTVRYWLAGMWAVLGTVHMGRHALAHLVVAVERLGIEQARRRSAELLAGQESVAIALLVRRLAIAMLVVAYYPAIMMTMRVPVPVILREYLGGGLGMAMSFLSYSFLPIYGSFLMVWLALYERGRLCLGEAITVANRRFAPHRGRIGERYRMGTKFWASMPVLLAALLFLPPRFGWNEAQGDNLSVAVMEGRIADAEKFLREGVDPNDSPPRGRAPLVVAVQNGNRAMVELLLTRGAKLAARDKVVGPLHAAVLAKRPELMAFLLERGAPIDAVDNTGDTALSLAAKRGDAEMVQTLVKRGANAEIRNDDGKSALDHARRLGHTSVVKALEERGVR
jgi:serine/threonine-protein kinase